VREGGGGGGGGGAAAGAGPPPPARRGRRRGPAPAPLIGGCRAVGDKLQSARDLSQCRCRPYQLRRN
jgi:hypothetical protein